MTPTLIVTRPEAQGLGFARALESRWSGPLDIVLSPLIAISFQPIVDDLSDVTDLVFTSAHGVTAATNLGLGPGLRAWCVGPKTAELARSSGFETVTGPGDAAALANLIIAQSQKGEFAHLRGRHSRGDLVSELGVAGIPCRDVIAYDQIAQPLTVEAQEVLNGFRPVLCPVFSPRTVTILSKQGPFSAPLDIVAMSQAVADAAYKVAPRSVTIAAHPDEDAMIAATQVQLHRISHDDD
ncbi:uroporphyrinogen-III synthase [Cognatiyoonia sp. IB215182]|uniref:uroporphyrinogen-III synthase n=1 Tax=Cognatiyoonia sp. IB215182 TaxID=3097353 RepID=UPI002A0D6BA9|nr:uroporphyrinogen-III synthase [Cognatiyoonia sp. IB215182]MDX8353002.1 uroporphyrinogen-III synthase [Cognatiyoonia sp. IB215182]